MKTLPKIFSEKTEHCGIKMRQIGQWPGPWEYAHTDQFGQSFDIFESKTARTICRTVSTMQNSEAESNAVLISIAPQLMKALKAFSCLTISECPHCGGSGKQYPKGNDACHRCGGTGDIVSDVLPDDVRTARSILARADKIGGGK